MSASPIDTMGLPATDAQEPQGAYYGSYRTTQRGALSELARALAGASAELDAAARALRAYLAGEESEPEPGTAERLRGQEITRVALRVASTLPPDAEIHYRDWFALVEKAGYRIGGRSPLDTFLAALSREPKIDAVGSRTGLYRIRAPKTSRAGEPS